MREASAWDYVSSWQWQNAAAAGRHERSPYTPLLRLEVDAQGLAGRTGRESCWPRRERWAGRSGREHCGSRSSACTWKRRRGNGSAPGGGVRVRGGAPHGRTPPPGPRDLAAAAAYEYKEEAASLLGPVRVREGSCFFVGPIGSVRSVQRSCLVGCANSGPRRGAPRALADSRRRRQALAGGGGGGENPGPARRRAPMRRSSPYSYAFFERLLQEHFPFPRRLFQVHALLLTSGVLLLDSQCSAAAFPYNCLAHAHRRVPAASSSRPPSAPLRLFCAMLARGARPNCHSFPSLLMSASASAAAALHAQCLRRGLAADCFVACSLVSVYGRTGHPSCDARKVFDEMEGPPDLASCNALLDALCHAGDLDGAGDFFERMAVRDPVSWTTLVSGLSRGGRHRCALEVFRGFLLGNVGRRLEEATLVSVFSACANVDGGEGLAAGMAVHAYLIRHEIELTAFLGTALVDMYGKHGRIGFCKSAFAVVCTKEVCTWNALLSALANHGKETDALVKFDMMRGEGFLPDQISFLALLTACARAGLVEVGLYWFDAMVAEYKVVPLMIHYGCVVDLLGRASRFGEAIQVIERMPFAADASVWGALLGACKLHGNVELAVEIGQKLMSLGPQQSGRYVTIRNVYLEGGNWHAGARMGEVMLEAGIKKTVGQSSVVLHGTDIPSSPFTAKCAGPYFVAEGPAERNSFG
ncbi:putative pentatricopeptide repeat-containing protein At1g10330 isoform X1 [Zea mays]|nr:putative pentatricopeptide repeat-containing protein At1g10330 isoform X1 [Zea mays]